MRYKIPGKFWGFGNNTYILNDSGVRVYYVHGPTFSWRYKVSIEDLNGRDLAFICRKPWSLRAHFLLHREGKQFAEMTRQFTWFRKHFVLHVPGVCEYTIEGSAWDRSFTVRRGGRNVASATLPLLARPYACEVEIEDGEDAVAILASCLIVIHTLRTEAAASAAS